MHFGAFGYFSAVCPLSLLCVLLISPLAIAQQAPAQPQPAAAPTTTAAAPASPDQGPVLPRGKKLFLKNGTFQLVREYQVEGDRVRYYSLDSLQWEEIPASLVDWDATKKEAAREQQEETALIKQAQKEQAEQNAEPLDIDASIQIGPGVFLPDGDGLFVYDSGGIRKMTEAAPEGNVSKGKLIEQVLIPIPVVPSRHVIYIPGEHAKLRLKPSEPEFYLRTSEPDQPELDLIRTKVEKGKRRIENLDEIAGERSDIRESIPIHILQMADGVFRVTVEKDLAPGEYAVLEVLRGAAGQTAEANGEMNFYVWDFGMDPAAPAHAAEK